MTTLYLMPYQTDNSQHHKVLTYVEYRAVPGGFQNIDPPPPSPPSECVLPPHQRRGVHTCRAVRGVGVNILEDASHRIGLLQSNLSTCSTHWPPAFPRRGRHQRDHHLHSHSLSPSLLYSSQNVQGSMQPRKMESETKREL
jgi:hypothetical protein